MEIEVIGLRRLDSSDANEAYVKWLSDPEVNRYLEIRHNPPTIAELKEWIEKVSTDKTRRSFAIEANGKFMIGTATLQNINHVHGTFGAGWMIGDKNYWGGTSAIQVMFRLLDFGFTELKMRKFIASVYQNHIKARMTNRYLGLTEEATIKHSHFFEGRLIDSIILTITNEQWSEHRLRIKADLGLREY
jgi:RimJ/RimL family protein N-acetyltransferase